MLRHGASYLQPAVNAAISNVPGSPIPLYVAGARLEGVYPFGPLIEGAGLNITVMSLSGKLDVGILSTPELLPDLWQLADAFVAEMKDLLAAAG